MPLGLVTPSWHVLVCMLASAKCLLLCSAAGMIGPLAAGASCHDAGALHPAACPVIQKLCVCAAGPVASYMHQKPKW